MSTNQANAQKTKSEAEAKAENWIESARGAADATHDKVADTANYSSGQAQQQKEETGSYIQQTGEKMAHMAQGALDGVKNTLGMNDQKK